MGWVDGFRYAQPILLAYLGGKGFMGKYEAVAVFDNDESGYLKWVEANPRGFVANLDKAKNILRYPMYPMVHKATHGSISSPTRRNYTTGEYFKFCSTDLDTLEEYSQEKFGRRLTYCQQCMR